MGAIRTTTVLTAASSYDLTDLATVKDELGLPVTDVSNDAFLGRAITQVSSIIANYCNRVFPVETVQDVIDIEQDPYPYQTPGGFAAVQLSRFPVVSVTSVAQTVSAGVTQALTEDTDFRVDNERGWLIRLSPFTGVAVKWEALPVTVTYSAGYAAIPDDLAACCLRVITARFKQRGRDPNLVSQTQGQLGEQRYWVGTMPGQNGPFPPDIQALLDGTYRVPVTA